MDEPIEVEDNIIRTSSLDYEPDGGLGYEFFRLMKFYGNEVAQYIVSTGEKNTYEDLLQKCIRTSLKLQSEGLQRNDLICLCTHNHENSCVPFIASTFLGNVVASLDPTLSVADTTHLLQQVKPAVIFLIPEAIELIEQSVETAEIQCRLVVFGESETYQNFDDYLEPHDEEKEFKPVTSAPEDVAVIFFSSGTTGLPKGICQSHYALLAQATNFINNNSLSSVSLFYSSLYWISSALLLTATVLAGVPRVICERFDPQEIWELIDNYKISIIFLATPQAAEMGKAGRPENVDTSSLLTIIIGGGVFSERLLLELRDLLPGTHICQAYGQTEVAGVLTCFRTNNVKDTLRLHYKPSSCGRPMKGIWYKIVDMETEQNLGSNKQGELRVQTRFSMVGYYNLDSSESYDEDGWLKTGDIVYYDDDLCFYVVDRIKEMLKYKSWHIPPALLENVLHDHPAVKKAVVIGVPDEKDGDHPMAVIILHNPDDDVTEQEIEDFVAERVQDRQKLRAGVKFVTTLPLTPSGKVKRRELKKMILEGEM